MQNYRKLYWTEHSKIKMRQYGLSKSKLINLLYKPERKEKGIAQGTIAVMKTNPIKSQGYPSKIQKKQISNGVNKFYLTKETGLKTKARLVSWRKKSPGEIWLMYKDTKDLRKIISAWRYPGISKPGEKIPIPEDIRREILDIGEI